MIKEFAIVTGQVNLVCLIIINLIVLFRYQQLPVDIRRVWCYLLLSLTTEAISRWLFHKFENNLFLLHYYTFFEFLVWSYFFYHVLKSKDWIRTTLPWLITVVGILIIANSIFLEPLTGFNSNAKALVQVLLISYTICYCFLSFGKIDLRQPIPRATTLINFAVLFYYSGSLFIFMFSKLLANQGVASKLQFSFWAINALLLVIFHALILVSLWMVAFRKTTSS